MPLESMVQEVQVGIKQAMATDAWKEAEALGAGSDDEEDEGGAGGGGGGGGGMQQGQQQQALPVAAAAGARRLKREHPEGQQIGAGGSVSMQLQQQGERCRLEHHCYHHDQCFFAPADVWDLSTCGTVFLFVYNSQASWCTCPRFPLRRAASVPGRARRGCCPAERLASQCRAAEAALATTPRTPLPCLDPAAAATHPRPPCYR